MYVFAVRIFFQLTNVFANFMQPGNQISPVFILGHMNLRSHKSHVSKLRFNINLSLRLDVGTYLINPLMPNDL
jgi:hypothetical protein